MKVNFSVSAPVDVTPKGKRKERTFFMRRDVAADIPELGGGDAPVAAEVQAGRPGSEHKAKIRFDGENLLAPVTDPDGAAFTAQRVAESGIARVLGDFASQAARRQSVEEWLAEDGGRVADASALDEAEREARRAIDEMAFVDGALHRRTDREPMHVVRTFGMGNDHGGTSVFVEWLPRDLSGDTAPRASNVERLDEPEAALALARRVAESRGDTPPTRISDESTVHIPEAFKANPYRAAALQEAGDATKELHELLEVRPDHDVANVYVDLRKAIARIRDSETPSPDDMEWLQGVARHAAEVLRQANEDDNLSFYVGNEPDRLEFALDREAADRAERSAQPVVPR